MLKWIVGSSLKYRYLVIALAAGLMFFGFQQLRHTPVDVFPEFAPPRVEVQTPSLGLSATEVESLVTIPLEQSLAGIPGLDELRSKSVGGLSSILLIFDRGTDLLTARQLVSERIAVIGPTLPTWAAPPFMIQPLSSTSRVMNQTFVFASDFITDPMAFFSSVFSLASSLAFRCSCAGAR